MREIDQRLLQAVEQADIERCLEQGANINVTNDYQETALILSVVKLQPQITRFLLQQNKIDLHIQSYLYGTALTFAIFNNQVTIAKLLLEKETCFNNAEHPSALNWAVLNRCTELIELLLQKGANINKEGMAGYEHAPDSVWKPEPDPCNTPFYREIFPQLKYTPLCLAIYNQDIEMIKYLLEKCQANPDQPNFNNTLPLAIAVQHNYLEAVDLLLQFNADPNPVISVKNEEDEPPAFLRRKPLINTSIKERLLRGAEQYKYSRVLLPLEHDEPLAPLPSVYNRSFFQEKKAILIPRELLEAFKGAFDLVWSALSDVNGFEKNILMSILNDPNFTPQQVVDFAKEITTDLLTNSIDVLYCALHPEKWEHTPFQEHKICLLDNTAKFSLPVNASPSEVNQHIDYLKRVAKKTVAQFFSGSIEELDTEQLNVKQKIIEKINLPKSPTDSEIKETLQAKGYIDDYLEPYLDDLKSSEYSYDTVLEKPISKIETKLDLKATHIWETLHRYSAEWKEVYNLIKLPPKRHMPEIMFKMTNDSLN